VSVPYRSRVELYDSFHELSGKDYRGEAERVSQVILARRPDADNLLDAACGTGRHLEHLARRFRCTGLDLNESMLELARGRVPGSVDLHAGDLRTFDLRRRFDAVTCLFSSVGYLRPLDEMRRGVANLARHLAPGGVMVIEPWITPDRWRDDLGFGIEVREDGDARLVRMTHEWRVGRTTELDMHYLHGSLSGIVHNAEHHILELYTFEEYRGAAEDAGCEVEMDEEGLIGRGLVIGVKR
jgi:SAM-dependent methyltransferase